MREDDFDPAEQHEIVYPEELPPAVKSLAGHVKRPRGLYAMRLALETYLRKRGIGTDSLGARIHADVAGDLARKGIKPMHRRTPHAEE